MAAIKNRITLEAIDGGVRFTFENCDHYLQNGTIDVPLNSLSLIFDESDMATFRKAASNDIFISAPITYFYGLDTKEDLADFYTENMVGGTGGGGSLVYYSEEEGQALIEVPSNIDGTNGVDVFNNGVNIYANEEQVGETNVYVSPTGVTINDDVVVTESMLDDYATVEELSGKADTSAVTVDEYSIYATRDNSISTAYTSTPITWIKITPKVSTAKSGSLQFSGVTGYLYLQNIDYVNGTYTVGSGSLDPSLVSGLSITFEDGAMIVEVDASNPITYATFTNTVIEYVKTVIPEKGVSDAVYDNLYPLIKKVDDSLKSVTVNSASTVQQEIGIRQTKNEGGSTNQIVSLDGYLSYSGTTLKAEAYVNSGTDTLTTVAPRIGASSRTDYYFTDNVGQRANASHIEIQILRGDKLYLAFYGDSINGWQRAVQLTVENGTVTSGNTWPAEATYSLSDGVLTVDYAFTGTSQTAPVSINYIMATTDWGSTASVSDIVGYVKALLKDKVEVTEYIENTLKPTINGIEDSEEVIAQSINVLSDSLSGKQDTLIAGSGITISGNVISADGGGGGATYSGGTNIEVSGDTINCTLPISVNSDTWKGDISFGTDINLGGKRYRLGIGRKILMSGVRSDGSIGIGVATTNSSVNNILYGQDSVGIGRGFEIGTSDSAGGVADKCVAIGNKAKTLISEAVAIGYNAQASGTTKTNINNQLTIDTSNQVYISNSANTSTYCVQQKIESTESALGGLSLVKLTQAQYDDLVTKDANTLYIIDNVVNNNS